MTILYSASKDEVLRQLHKLTDASYMEKYDCNPVMRQLGSVAYRQAYDWLEQHGVPFVYDREEGCYVVEVSDGD